MKDLILNIFKDIAYIYVGTTCLQGPLTKFLKISVYIILTLTTYDFVKSVVSIIKLINKKNDP